VSGGSGREERPGGAVAEVADREKVNFEKSPK